MEHEYIKKYKEKFGDLYDYSETEYINNKTKIKIFCNTNKQFFHQYPKDHFKGVKSQSFTKFKKGDSETFIKESKEKYGEETFNYDKVNYININTEVTLQCNKHDLEFNTKPSDHKLKPGCPLCNKNTKFTKETFLLKSNFKFNNKFIYNLENFTDSKSTIKVKCPDPEHDWFEITATNHLHSNKGVIY